MTKSTPEITLLTSPTPFLPLVKGAATLVTDGGPSLCAEVLYEISFDQVEEVMAVLVSQRWLEQVDQTQCAAKIPPNQ
jgi:hypothetical protein